MKDNQIIGNFVFQNTKVEFKGTGNILYASGDICLENSRLRFTRNNLVMQNNDYIN